MRWVGEADKQMSDSTVCRIIAVQIKPIWGEEESFSWHFPEFFKFLKIRLVPFKFVIPAEAGIQEYGYLGSGFPFSRE